MFGLGYGEMLLVGFIAVLLFGKKLPEVARSLGKGVTEFKKGIKGLEDEFHQGSFEEYHREIPHSTDRQAPSAPKFEPPADAETEEEPFDEESDVSGETGTESQESEAKTSEGAV